MASGLVAWLAPRLSSTVVWMSWVPSMRISRSASFCIGPRLLRIAWTSFVRYGFGVATLVIWP